MDRTRLKNIIILILALMDLFLLGSLAMRRSQERADRLRMEAELTELLASEGIRLSTGLPDELPPAGRTLHRDVSADRLLASSLLGSGMTESDEGGGIYAFTSPTGRAQFRASGRFEAAGQLAKSDPEAVCKKFCQAFGYGDLTLELEGGSGAGSAVQYFEGYPVVNAAVEFLVEDNCLISVSGVHLPSEAAAGGQPASAMTAATALSKFLEARRASGAVVSELTDLYLCYEAQSSAAAPISLSPSWCVATDTGDYYVNCATGAVTRR